MRSERVLLVAEPKTHCDFVDVLIPDAHVASQDALFLKPKGFVQMSRPEVR
jgi:hypothetical protein